MDQRSYPSDDMRLVGSIHPEVSWVPTHGAPGDDLSKQVHGLAESCNIESSIALCGLYIQAMQCRYTDTMQQCCHLASKEMPWRGS